MGSKKVAIILAEGFEEIEAVTAIDLLRRAGIEVTVIGLESPVITGAQGISIEADITLDEAEENYDGVVIPGGMPGASHIAESKEAGRFICRLGNDSALVAAICAAPAVVLAPLGLLSGRRYTCYPGMEELVQDDSASHSSDRVVADGNLITSKGPGTAAEFSVSIISYLIDKKMAQRISETSLQK